MAIMEETSTEKPAVPKVSRAAIRAYRESVFDNRCDPEINFAGRRIDAEWRADRATYESRVRACKTLKEDVPRLEAAAADAARAVAEAQQFAATPLADGLTVAELRARLHAANPNLPASTPAELAQGLLFLVGSMPDGAVGRLKSKALSARAAVGDTAAQAQRLLRQTAATVAPDGAVAKLAAQIEQLQSSMAKRQPILRAESQVATVRAECQELAAGRRPPTFSSIVGQQQKPLATLYRTARRKLDELLDMVSRKPDAEKANARDLEELGRLKAKLAGAEQTALLRLADPQAMLWCE